VRGRWCDAHHGMRVCWHQNAACKLLVSCALCLVLTLLTVTHPPPRCSTAKGGHADISVARAQRTRLWAGDKDPRKQVVATQRCRKSGEQSFLLLVVLRMQVGVLVCDWCARVMVARIFDLALAHEPFITNK
jgi:hypothetical protein